MAEITSIRIMFAIISIYKFEACPMDVKMVFLYDDLIEEIYINQLEGYVVKGKGGNICKLIKSLYELKQASR